MKKVFFTLMFLVSAVITYAQNGDTYYNQGLSQQKVKTAASQRKAIQSFTTAKSLYDAKVYKNKCDERIAECNKWLNSGGSNSSKQSQYSVTRLRATIDSLQNLHNKDSIVIADMIRKENEEKTKPYLRCSCSHFEILGTTDVTVSIQFESNYPIEVDKSQTTWANISNSSNEVRVNLPSYKNKKLPNRINKVVVKAGDMRKTISVSQTVPTKGPTKNVININNF